MDGILFSYKAENLIDSGCVSMAQQLSKIWDKHVSANERHQVILVDTGTWLAQRAWSDETGYFIKIRLSPMYSSRRETQAKGRKVLEAFIDLFPHRKAEYVEGDATFCDGHQNTVTVVVYTDRHSIGD